jgi:long-chain acyl-CoA synthetase
VADVTLAKQLEQMAERLPDKDLFVSDDRTVTYGEFDMLAGRLAGGLADIGVKEGDRVAVMGGSHPEFVATFYAIWKLGAIGVAINGQLTPEEVQYQLQNSGARAAVADEGRPREIIDKVASHSADLERILVLGQHLGEPRRAIDIDESADATIFYTSGTTGVPKGATHTHRALRVQLDMIAQHYALSEDDQFLSVLPLYLLSILILGPLSAIHAGSTCRLMSRYDAREFARHVKTDRTSIIGASIPLMFSDLLDLPEEEAADVDLSSIRIAACGGSPMPPEIRRAFEDRYRFRFIHAFGGTEGPAVVSTDPMRADRKFDSVGVPLPHIKVTIEDDDGSVLPPGEVGEICTGPQDDGPYAGLYEPLRCYWSMPEETAEALRDGKFHWGDLGYVDEDGFLYIVDRKKDMIIRGGMNVYPKELEKLLYEDERIAEVAVVGAPHPRYGEVPVAFVRTSPGADLDEAAVKPLVNDRTASFKHLHRVQFVEDFPRNALGKILKRELRDQLDDSAPSTSGPA